MAARLRWHGQVTCDRRLRPSTGRVASYLLHRFNFEFGGYAWPSQQRIADDLSLTKRCIQLAINQLVHFGYLSVETGRGPGCSNRYRFLNPELCEVADAGSDTGSEMANEFDEMANAGVQEGESDFAQIHTTNPGNILNPRSTHHGAAEDASRDGAGSTGPGETPSFDRQAQFPNADLRAVAVQATNERWVRLYLDRCRWDERDRTVTPPSGAVDEQLRDRLGHLLRDNGVRLRPWDLSACR
jgi:hypothetical protein